jgi:hypothetical protein
MHPSMLRSAKRSKLQSSGPTAVAPYARDSTLTAAAASRPRPPAFIEPQLSQHAEAGIAVMLLDVEEESCGSFYLWGLTKEHLTVLVRVEDYHPYLYLPAPKHAVQDSSDSRYRPTPHLLANPHVSSSSSCRA